MLKRQTQYTYILKRYLIIIIIYEGVNNFINVKNYLNILRECELYKLRRHYTIFYFYEKKNMAEILKFVYTIILFLSLFLVTTIISDGKSFFEIFFNFVVYINYYHVLATLFYFLFIYYRTY